VELEKELMKNGMTWESKPCSNDQIEEMNGGPSQATVVYICAKIQEKKTTLQPLQFYKSYKRRLNNHHALLNIIKLHRFPTLVYFII